MIENPVLRGFNPDPSMIRLGDDYYIATSTFEWFPGVQVHHSTDLVNWRLVSRPLSRPAQLDMRGNPDSGGIWAPCLSHADGRFWLVYTDVKRLDGAFKDAHNYIVTCDRIDGDWSDPIYVNSSGFDPSLFHDDDGRKWFVNMLWNHRGPGTGGNPAHASFDGILLQQWSEQRGLFGPISNIFGGSGRGLTEAPHLFKRRGYYYLTTAEGGTGYQHAVTLARSRQVEGPYQLHPDIHLICNAGDPDNPIQRTGHGQYVETPSGEVYHSFLMGRPIPGPDGSGRFCPLGRETGLEKCVWKDDDWLYLEHGGMTARAEVPAPVEIAALPQQPIHYRFDAGLPIDFQWLRTPYPERLFEIADGKLVLIGRESIGSWFEQSLVARRQQHLAYRVETTIDMDPDSYQQGAGLTTYYNRHKFHALVISHDAEHGRSLWLMSCNGDFPACALEHPLQAALPLVDGPVDLAVEVDHAEQQFYFRQGGGDWREIGPRRNAAIISDEGGRGEHASFTGAFVGVVAYDISGQAARARVSAFSYLPATDRALPRQYPNRQ